MSDQTDASADVERYLLAKRHIVEVARSMDRAQLAATCPSCPLWTNQDVIAHHIHFLEALVDEAVPEDVFTAITDLDPDRRRESGTRRDEWTQAGVEARRGRTVDQLVDEWDELLGRMAPQDAPTVDAVVHLGDLRESLGRREGVDARLSVHTLRRYYAFTYAGRLATVGELVALRCTDTGTLVGEAPGALEIRGTAYELMRTIAGRRTRAEADRALDWGATADPSREQFPAYGWPQD